MDQQHGEITDTFQFLLSNVQGAGTGVKMKTVAEGVVQQILLVGQGGRHRQRHLSRPTVHSKDFQNRVPERQPVLDTKFWKQSFGHK
jgi:hypothetical protein